MNERVEGKAEKLSDGRERGYEVKQVLYAGDEVLMEELTEDFQ